MEKGTKTEFFLTVQNLRPVETLLTRVLLVASYMLTPFWCENSLDSLLEQTYPTSYHEEIFSLFIRMSLSSDF